MTAEERARAEALLETQHSFPGAFGLRVVIVPTAREAVLAAIAAVDGIIVTAVDHAESSRGRWASLRVTVDAQAAGAVLDCYAAVKDIDGVVLML